MLCSAGLWHTQSQHHSALSSKPFLTQFFSTKSKTKWKTAEVKWAQSSPVHEDVDTLTYKEQQKEVSF